MEVGGIEQAKSLTDAHTCVVAQGLTPYCDRFLSQ